MEVFLLLGRLSGLSFGAFNLLASLARIRPVPRSDFEAHHSVLEAVRSDEA